MTVDQTLRAVADPTRRSVLQLIEQGELPAGEIARHFPQMSRPAVSQHLRVLVDAGLVVVRSNGKKRLYRLRPGGLDEAAQVFQSVWATRLARLRLVAEEEERRA